VEQELLTLVKQVVPGQVVLEQLLQAVVEELE